MFADKIFIRGLLGAISLLLLFLSTWLLAQNALACGSSIPHIEREISQVSPAQLGRKQEAYHIGQILSLKTGGSGEFTVGREESVVIEIAEHTGDLSFPYRVKILHKDGNFYREDYLPWAISSAAPLVPNEWKDILVRGLEKETVVHQGHVLHLFSNDTAVVRWEKLKGVPLQAPIYTLMETRHLRKIQILVSTDTFQDERKFHSL